MKTYHKNNERLVTKVFQDVFDKYDLMNDLMSLGIHRIWKKNFIHWLNPQKKTTLIDVASGTGDIAKLYLNKINYKGCVYCVDENKGMLDLNKRKFKGNTRVKWFCNSAEKLPFKNNHFDYYTISFGIRNVSNLNNTLKLIKKVPKDFTIVGESGIKKFQDIRLYNDAGVYNFLIGESILTSKNIQKKFDELLNK